MYITSGNLSKFCQDHNSYWTLFIRMCFNKLLKEIAVTLYDHMIYGCNMYFYKNKTYLITDY